MVKDQLVNQQVLMTSDNLRSALPELLPQGVCVQTMRIKCGTHLFFSPSYLLSFVSFFGPGCHLYSINTHHGSELRIVAAIRTKLLLITRRHPRFSAVATGADSPVEEFQYIRVWQSQHTDICIEKSIYKRMN